MRLLTLKTILVATDLDEGSRAALATARALAESAGAAVHVVHVAGDQGALETLASRIGDLGIPPDEASLHVVRGDPAHAINILGDKLGADAIVIGPHRARREAEGRSVLGSTALALVTNAAVPCMVATTPLRVPLRRVVAAVDISDTAQGTLAVALSWASALRGQRGGGEPATVLTVLHVSPPAERGRGKRTESGKLAEMLEYVRREAGSWASVAIESAASENADAASGIASYATADHAEVVVLGTRGLGTERIGRVGSVAAAVLKQLDVPVLLVPPALWATLAVARG